MRLKSSLLVAAFSTLVIACVTVAPSASVAPGASTVPSASAPLVSSAAITPGIPTGAATAETTAGATAQPPTEAPPATPRPSRRPRPTPTASPTEPPDIDVAVYQYVITPHTDDPAAGFHVDLDITIENKGSDKAKKFTVAVTCLGYTQEQDVFGGIEGGGQYVISFGFYLSIPGDKSNKIVLDSKDRLAETDEENNLFELSSAPDEYPSSCDREAGDSTEP